MGAVLENIWAVWCWLIDHLLYINLILSVVIVFFQRKDPKSVWLWLLVLYFVPIFGFFLYLVLCQDYRKSKMFHVKEVEDRVFYTVKVQEEVLQRGTAHPASSKWRDYETLIDYNLETSGAVLTMDNTVDIFTDGKEKFDDLKRELAQARKYIHIQYYIIKNDELFQSIIPILKEKAKEGVEVRILYDGVGGRFTPPKVWKELQDAGVRVGAFFPVALGKLNLRINYLRINYRNHRKIVVIDGRVGYVGGFNIGREYISKDPKFGYWRDTHLKLRGSAVYSLQIRFALDWNYATKENLFQDGRYFRSDEAEEGDLRALGQDFPEMDAEWDGASAENILEQATDQMSAMWKKSQEERKAMVQIIASGPDASNRQIRNNYIQLFYRARRHIYIQTPYFVPDDAVLSALKFAAESGIDVRLMIPCKPDHPFVYWATYSYMGDLMAAGARCYVYENGFLHAKGVTVDGLVSCYGTANMDIRSFELNFEVNATIYDEEVAERFENIFREDLKHCREVTKADYARRSLLIRVKEQCCRLLSPLL